MNPDDDFEVIWHDPPLTGRWGPRLERFYGILKEHPGEWGELPPLKDDSGDVFYPLTVLTSFRKKYGDSIDSRSVTAGENRIRIYARYKGETDPEAVARGTLRSVRPTT